jgi:hypothetical protein
MNKLWAMIAAAALLVALASGRVLLGTATDAAVAVSCAPGAGIIALPSAHPERVRLLYARNGGMVLLREISVPGRVRGLALSADGRDLFVSTDDNAYTLSTRTGEVEAQLVAAAEERRAPSADSGQAHGG